MKNRFVYETSLGKIVLEEKENYITRVDLLRADEVYESQKESELLKKTIEEIREYLAGTRREFDIPILMEGTDFQKKVWRQLQQIPYGETRSYKDIAKAAGNPKASRAVGNANNKNPIMIIVPCHRVIGASGRLVGFGAGLDIKEKLLKIEESIKYHKEK